MNKDNKWEKVNTNTKRLKVDTGWIVAVTHKNQISTCFVSDIFHTWKLKGYKGYVQ
ncbi:MAG: hypothetical protein ACTSPD_10255 [Promethearchaeota archaeon]|mgnify:CR=1 FL=1